MQSAELGVQITAAKTEEQPQKKTRVRKVFGRREAEVNGRMVRVELRADGVYVRQKRSRLERTVSFRDLWCVANGQGLLRL